MSTYSLSHLADGVLLRDLATLVARDRTTTAALLAHLAEVEARRLYLPAAHPSMFSYCVHELRLSEEAALKRIRAARAARQFPAIFSAIADGRLHLSAIVLLASRLTPETAPETADELLAAAAHKSKSEIEQVLAERFPQRDVPARVQDLSLPPFLSPLIEQPSPGTVVETAEQLSPGTVQASSSRPKVSPLSPQRFALQVTIDQDTHDMLRYAQELLSHTVRSGDVAAVLKRSLAALIRQLEKRKFAATEKPRSGRRRTTTGKRYVPAHVKHAVWKRDGGRCTFVSEAGHRCPARTLIEYDHVDEVARGGQATVARMRLRCRAHNQHSAECTFGIEFMKAKRQQARRAAADARAQAAAAARTKAEEVERAKAEVAALQASVQ